LPSGGSVTAEDQPGAKARAVLAAGEEPTGKTVLSAIDFLSEERCPCMTHTHLVLEHISTHAYRALKQGENSVTNIGICKFLHA
jgi:hypothetical protein